MMILGAARRQDWAAIERVIRRFQQSVMAMKLAARPVVVAPFGMTLGGGAEVTLHGQRVRAGAETYIGLVEVGAGLIPAGGRLQGAVPAHPRTLGRAAGRAAADLSGDRHGEGLDEWPSRRARPVFYVRPTVSASTRTG